MNDKEKAIISGITVVITMIKLIVQHRVLQRILFDAIICRIRKIKISHF